VAVYGQTLSLPTKVSASPGTYTELSLTISPGQSKLTALQWEVVFPGEQATLDTFRLGPAGQFKIGRTTGPITIRIENAKGVSADLKAIDFAPSEGEILVK